MSIILKTLIDLMLLGKLAITPQTALSSETSNLESTLSSDNQPQITQVSYEEKGKEKNLDFYENNEIIVKTSNPEVLRERGYEISPLINWEIKNPELLKDFVDIYIVKTPENAVASLQDIKNVGGVIYAELNPIGTCEYTPTDPLYGEQWNMHLINAESAWDVTLGSEETILAVYDSGIDSDHPEFQERILSGKDFVNNDNNPEDDEGHGTEVTGNAAAQINNEGIAGLCQCSILPVKVADKNGYFKYSHLAQGILWTLDIYPNVSVLNFSLGGDGPTVTLQNAIKSAAEHEIPMVASAGNDGQHNSNNYPSSDPEVISVGAVGESDQRVGFSNYGDNVTIYAPGDIMWNSTIGGYTNEYSGTSYAAPHVSGTIALIKSIHSDYTKQDIEKALLETADTIQIDKGTVIRLNAGKAVRWQKPGIEEQTPTQRTSELSDVLLGNSNLYQTNFPERGTLTIYDGKTGQRVRESINVNGNTELNLSDLSAGVYFGIYKAENGRHQTQKIVKVE